MKREELKELGIAEELIDKVMAAHGKDVEAHKAKLTATEAERETLKGQLTEANKAIDGFKALDVEGVKKSAEEYRAKFEKAEADGKAALAALRFETALENALGVAKAKNAKAVRALLNVGDLKLNEAGELIGLKEQLEKVQKDAGYLFEDGAPEKKIVVPQGGKPPEGSGGNLGEALREKLFGK